jgi:hypothetical protein
VFSCKEEASTTSNETTMRINNYTEDCIGEVEQKCLLVQEGSLIGTNDWEYFYSEIEGFNYEEGYIYNLKVKKTTIENPPMDASSIKYELLELLSKEQ